MKNGKILSISILLLFGTIFSSCASDSTDVLIIGGGASGTAAGIQAARMGVKTTIIEESTWLGGMLTSAGVSAIDGNYNLRSGLFGEFCDSLAQHYGGYDSLKTGWVSNVLFEPSVGNRTLQKMTAAEPNLTIRYQTELRKAEQTPSGEWIVTLLSNGKYSKIRAKVLIDGTELGDLAKMCGVKYDIGMDARQECGEAIAPEKANDIIQDLTYVAVLKDYGPDADKTIPCPKGYDPSLFYCTCKVEKCTNPKESERVWDCPTMLTYGKLPNNKYMINWPIEGNDYYVNIVEMDRQERKEALDKAKQFTLCYLYYLQTELGYKHLGLADDEFPTEDQLPFIPYHRESRRIHGLARLTINHIAHPFDQPEALYRTGIAVGDYPIDHHHARYPEWSKLPNLYFYPVPSYNVPLGSLIPQGVRGVIVAEKSISVTNIVNGSTRLQPVVLQIGQAAGALAALAIQEKKDPSEISIRQVQTHLLNSGVYLMPYLDLPKADPHFKAIQRIGTTGILRGTGINVGWSNQTWFYTDSLLQTSDLKRGLAEIYPEFKVTETTPQLTVAQSMKLINRLAQQEGIAPSADQKLWNSLSLGVFEQNASITRGHFAVLIDAVLNPFVKEVNHQGAFLEKKAPSTEQK